MLLKDRVAIVTGGAGINVMGQYGITFWLPAILRNAGVSGVGTVGLLAAIPYTVALLCLPLVGRSSDRTLARRLHCGVPMAVGAATLFPCPSPTAWRARWPC